jgi:hypothetical protein
MISTDLYELGEKTGEQAEIAGAWKEYSLCSSFQNFFVLKKFVRILLIFNCYFIKNQVYKIFYKKNKKEKYL